MRVTFRTARRWAAATVAGAVVGVAGGQPAVAQNDPLDRIKALRAVADQKAEAHVLGEIAEADKVAKASPATAARRLRAVVTSLDLSAEISAEKRQELVELLQARIAGYEGRPVPPAADPKAAKQREDARKVQEAAAAEAKAVREGVAEIERLHGLNKFPEAQAKVAELAKRFPDNPSVLMLAGQAVTQERLLAAKDLAREMDDRFTFVMNDAARSALPAKRDMEFDKDFARRMEQRRKLEPKLIGPEEEAILQALEKSLAGGIKDAPFEETLQTLSNLIDKPIYLDKKSLEDAGLDMRRPVTVPANVTARTALRGVLQSQGLTFIIKDKVIQVVTFEKAKESFVTRSYYLGDVVAGTGPFGGGPTWGPVADYQQMMANAQLVIDSITRGIDPLIWQGRTGASVTFHPLSMSLIVRAPAEVHSSISTAFERKR